MSNYEHGFIAANDIVITGYGLTIDTIENWLTNHHIDPKLLVEPEEITNTLDQKFPNNQVTYTYVDRFDEELLYIPNPSPPKTSNYPIQHG